MISSASGPKPKRQRNRPKVPEEKRQRVAKARSRCESCRRIKEKCHGGYPCTKCVRMGRDCVMVDLPKPVSRPRSQHATSDSDIFDPERIKMLEDVVAALTGSSVFDKRNLQETIDLSKTRRIASETAKSLHELSPVESQSDDDDDDDEIFAVDPVSKSTAIYAGELSNSNFSQRVQQVAEPGVAVSEDPTLRQTISRQPAPRALPLHSELSAINEAAESLPPRDVADFLLDVFFEFGQTNYSYVDERSLRERLDCYYTRRTALTVQSAPWVCTALIIFAVGTQFAHLCKPSSASGIAPDDRENSTDDAVSLNFYRSAARLVPDTIAMASIESVQAFILLGIYALPVDAAGLSCTYFGIATKIAIHNGMHRKGHQSVDLRQTEMRNRIWWTTYILERRTAILHGRPISIRRSETDADLPSELPELAPAGRTDNLRNVMAMIRLTEYLEEARDLLQSLQRSARSQRPAILDSLRQMNTELQRYWAELPHETFCRDLNPTKPLFRFNTHLALIYHWIHVFIGRSFILSQPRKSTASPPQPDSGTPSTMHQAARGLVEECIRSALSIIDLCQHLHDHVGLGRASYTEFTSCSAALVALLAQQIQTKTTTYLANCGKGIKLMKQMSVGLYANPAEKRTVETLELAVRRLHHHHHHHHHHRLDDGGDNHIVAPNTADSPSAYQLFRNWATKGRRRGGGSGGSSSISSSGQFAAEQPPPIQTRDNFQSRHVDGLTRPIVEEGGLLGGSEQQDTFLYPYDFGDLISLPGLDQWFEYG